MNLYKYKIKIDFIHVQKAVVSVHASITKLRYVIKNDLHQNITQS
jgi:hypothetical protein